MEEAELGQYFRAKSQFKKILKMQWEFEPLSPKLPLGSPARCRLFQGESRGDNFTIGRVEVEETDPGVVEKWPSQGV